MAPCKFPCAVLMRRLNDNLLNKLSNNLRILLYSGKELTCHKATDPLVRFNRRVLSVGLKQDHHFINQVIFLYNV